MIFINIIYDINSSNVRLTDYSELETYELNDLRFYVSNQFNKDIFCIIIDSDNNKNVIKLGRTGEGNRKYNIYMPSLDNASISLKNGLSKITLFYFDDNLLMKSNSITVNLKYDNFVFINKLYVLQNISEEIKEIYNKISEISKLNIELYKDIKEVSEK